MILAEEVLTTPPALHWQSAASTTYIDPPALLTSGAELLQDAGEEGESPRGSQEVQYSVFYLTNVISNKCKHNCKSEFEYGGGQGINRSKVAVALLCGVR